MIFCCDFWWRSGYPKFYEYTVAMMKGADGRAFLTHEDLVAFVDRLRKQIEKDKPKGHSAYISFSPIGNDGKGWVYLESGKLDTSIARLFIHNVKNIVTYGDKKQAMFDVKKGGAA
ncbi:MAG: hypothetical protein IJ253_12700 [Bacteroidaceae bacterium]|nr:hypothetical protein [Bacteroidaceae bacterium]